MHRGHLAGGRLDQAGESESIAFCQELFAPELGGHKLLSNRSLWISFVTVRCQSWHHGNVVLLGDAAHTAHFTIGSGTKLAMEDAVALGQALQRHLADLEAAFTDYELERQPVVERFQEAARDSATWFENVRRYDGFDPVQFACNLLTRSGRIGHLELTRRDPAFAAAVDRRFAGRPAAGPAAAVRAAGPAGGDPGQPGRPGRRARTTPTTAACPPTPPGAWRRRPPPGRGGGERAGRGRPRGPRHPRHPGPVGRRPGRAVGRGGPGGRGAGPTLVLRLGHAGRRGATRPRRAGVDRPLPAGGWPLQAASAIPYTPSSQVPAAMTPADMEGVVREFAVAARRAAAAGVEVLLLDLAHGYLLGGFLSPLANRRGSGAAGGRPLPSRWSTPSATPGPTTGLWAAMTATDWAPGGLDPDEAVAVARTLAANGCDLLQVTAGQTTATTRPDYGRFHLVGWSDLVRNSAAVPTMVGAASPPPTRSTPSCRRAGRPVPARPPRLSGLGITRCARSRSRVRSSLYRTGSGLQLVRADGAVAVEVRHVRVQVRRSAAPTASSSPRWSTPTSRPCCRACRCR